MNLHYDWRLDNTTFTKDRGRVFSCFSCGGGSTMGYKLAGFDVIGCNEIDPRMMDIYKANHNPKFTFLAPIQEFKLADNLPADLYELDILDGSPPCSSFSITGNREKDWGKEKVFAEGQALQVLDTLFFDFIDLAKKLQPKMIIAENVKGLLMGDAKGYVHRILLALDDAGYFTRFDLLNAATLGISQSRERVMFSCIRKDLYRGQFDDLFESLPRLKMLPEEPLIPFSTIFHDYMDRPLTERYRSFWDARQPGDRDFSDCSERMGENPNAQFQYGFIYQEEPTPTMTAGDRNVLFDYPRYANFDENCERGSWPKDYNFLKTTPWYVMGMSVPPLMMAKHVDNVYSQWMESTC